jgi:uncharacterized membrane protein YjgN (DUF898 family)
MQRGAAATTWSHKDPLLALYAFNAGLLALKMFILAVSTGVARKMKKVLQKHCVANSPRIETMEHFRSKFLQLSAQPKRKYSTDT